MSATDEGNAQATSKPEDESKSGDKSPSVEDKLVTEGSDGTFYRGILLFIMAFVVIYGWFAPIIKDTNASIAVIVVDAIIGVMLFFMIMKTGFKNFRQQLYIPLFVAIILDFIITILIVRSDKPLEFMHNPGILFVKGLSSSFISYFFVHLLMDIINKKSNVATERYRHSHIRK